MLAENTNKKQCCQKNCTFEIYKHTNVCEFHFKREWSPKKFKKENNDAFNKFSSHVVIKYINKLFPEYDISDINDLKSILTRNQNMKKNFDKINFDDSILLEENIKKINKKCLNCKELKFKIKELKNEIKENNYEIEKLRKDYELLKIKIDNKNSNNSINNYNKDNYLKYIFEEDAESKKDKLIKKINKNILKYKLCNIFKELYLNKDIIVKERNDKIDILRKKMELNIIKFKTINILRIFNNNHNTFNRVLNKIQGDIKTIKFDNKKVHKSILNSNRYKIDFLANLYEEKEINKSLSNKDFMLAVNEFHNDKNPTRMKHLCHITYELRKNEVIWKSDIIFNHLYTFQNIKEYQISYLIENIEKIVILDNLIISNKTNI